jgi:hypothetical protein
MSEGSGLFTKVRPVDAYSVKPRLGGISGETKDLRKDVTNAFAPMSALCVEEYVNPLAPAVGNLMAASVTPAADVTLTLLPVAGGGTNALTLVTVQNLTQAPRQLVFTTGGATETDAPASATVYGLDERGVQFTEVVPLQQVAAAATTSNFFSSITKIVYAVGEGANATIAIGLGSIIGISRSLIMRAGRYAIIQEVAAGVAVTNGVFKLASESLPATVLGTVDLVTAVPVMPTTQSITFEVGGRQRTITFHNPADLAAICSTISHLIGPGFATAGGTDNKYLKLTDDTLDWSGTQSTLRVVSGTGVGADNILNVLGLLPNVLYRGVSQGKFGSYTPNHTPDGSTSYAVYYEYDGAAP